MDAASLTSLLDDSQSVDRLRAWGLHDAEAGRQALVLLAEQGLSLDLLGSLLEQLGRELIKVAEPDAVLRAFADYVAAARSPLALVALFERDAAALPTLLRVLDLGPRWRHFVVDDSEAFDLLRMTDGQPVSAAWLKAEICGELASYADERLVMSALRRIKQREVLRVAYGDLLRHQSFDTVTEQLTAVAEAIVEAAVRAARRRMQELRQEPKWARDGNLRFAVIGLDRFGGREMDYTDHLDLLFLHDPLPEDDHARRQGQEYFDRLARHVLRILGESHGDAVAYSVAMPLRIDGQTSATLPIDEALAYFDGFGRTWHREAFIKARAVAGDEELANHFLQQLEPWVYRRYLSRADETGIKALKRRLERRTLAERETLSLADLSATVRQVEEATQFLQLLSGGDQPQARVGGTLAAIAALEQASVLAVDERTLLEENYRRLRTLEHRLQIVGPERIDASAELSAGASRLAKLLPADTAWQSAGEIDWPTVVRATDAAIGRLLGSAFPDEGPVAPEVDLLLDPQPSDEWIVEVLSPYGFRDVRAAYRHLGSLASERVPFLSTRRCRYFLAAIAPRLLAAVAATPDPDYTLANLSQVSDSLGGKGVLWELFRAHPPSMQLYVRLCAASPYLSSILTSNPGMLDELVDSLQLRRLPTIDDLQSSLAELCRGAADPLAVLQGFKNSRHLQIGVRDILGREQIDATHRALADVAETCLVPIAQVEYDKLVEKYGEPTIGAGPLEGQPCPMAILALGKLAGREPNYHSGLTVAFLYEADGHTRPLLRGRREQRTANSHFFSQLAQRVAKEASRLTPQGRLYSVETPLRPATGAMAMSLAELEHLFRDGGATLSQWRELCQARAIHGPAAMQAEAMRIVSNLLTSREPQPGDAPALREARLAFESGASSRNLKRGRGGSLDIEFIVQALQLQSAGRDARVVVPGTLEAIEALARGGFLSEDDAAALAENYRFLRRIESAVRLLNTDARHDLPAEEINLRKLAMLIRWDEPEGLADRCQQVMEENRQRFDRLLSEETPDNP